MSGMTRLRRFAVIAFFACVASSALAQAGKSATDHTDSRVDLYGGYGYFHPLNSGIDGYQYQDVSNPNVTVGVSAFFNKYVGLQIEGGYFSGNLEHAIYNSSTPTPCTGESCSQIIYTAEAGPILRLPLGAFVPFIHALGGGARINGPTQQPLFWGWGVTGGAGVDYVLPPFNHRFALRGQGDWQYSQVVYGPLVLPAGTHGGFGEIGAIKFSGGLVVRFGESRDKPPVQLGCSVAPVSAFPGDPLKINGTTLNTNPKLKQVFTWTTNGGRIVGGGLEPALDTTGLKAGEYVVRGHLSEGTKSRERADCDAPFTIRAFEPPTIACSATPNVITSGDEVAISTTGGSPQNRPLTYSYSTTAGIVTSSGPTAKLTTAGLSPATVTITCNVVDDLGQTAVSTTQITVNAAPVPVKPSTRPLCGFSFLRDKRRPTRVDNEAKGCLDDIALTLNKETDANLIIVGNYDAAEKEEAGAERTLNARQYLTKEKGIDPARITLRIGDASGKTVTDTLVPSGASFNDIGTHTFDESTIVRKGPAYGIPKTPAATKGKHRRKVEPAAVPVVSPNVAPVAALSTTPGIADKAASPVCPPTAAGTPATVTPAAPVKPTMPITLMTPTTPASPADPAAPASAVNPVSPGATVTSDAAPASASPVTPAVPQTPATPEQAKPASVTETAAAPSTATLPVAESTPPTTVMAPVTAATPATAPAAAPSTEAPKPADPATPPAVAPEPTVVPAAVVTPPTTVATEASPAEPAAIITAGTSTPPSGLDSVAVSSAAPTTMEKSPGAATVPTPATAPPSATPPASPATEAPATATPPSQR